MNYKLELQSNNNDLRSNSLDLRRILEMINELPSAPTASIFVTGLSEADTVTAVKGGKTVQGKWTSRLNPEYVVPDEYTQLSYIESDDKAYINSGVSGNINSLAVECDGTSSSDTSLFGYVDMNNGNGIQVITYTSTNTSRFSHGGVSKDITGVCDAVFKLDKNKCYINGELVHTFTLGSYATGNIFLFGRSNNGTLGESGVTLIRSCKMWLNDVLLRHFIPAKRNSDSAIGMYDIVNNVFYTNAGSGTFIAGAEVPQYIYGHEIHRLSFGTWIITVTNGEKTTTQNVLVNTAMEYEIEMKYKLWLYREGDECTDITGGWSSSEYMIDGAAVVAATKLDDCFYADASTADTDVLGTQNAIDFSKYVSLCVERSQLDATNLFQPWIGALTIKDATNAYRAVTSPGASSANVRETTVIDISGLNGSYYVAFCHTNGMYSGSGYLYNVWLE